MVRVLPHFPCQSLVDQHETQPLQEPTDTRLRSDSSELAWLIQLPGSVVPANGETSVESVAGRSLPELRAFIRARIIDAGTADEYSVRR
jgi:hypothetical protein